MAEVADNPAPVLLTERATGLQDLLARLITPEVIYFPIRHHSPACARQLQFLIRQRKPGSILIEGPENFTSLIPLILHAKTRPPVAVYTSFVAGEPGTEEKHSSLGPPRFAAYYPFCDYSPEMVALRAGAEIGAKLRFIDLTYPEQVLAEQKAAEQTGAPKVESLLAESHFKRSQFLQALARRAGCRDHNDLWDHLFETRVAGGGTDSNACEQFIRDVASWCYFARADTPSTELQLDGTHARESAMAAHIRQELQQSDGSSPVLVVTGGFHTVLLPKLVCETPAPSPKQTGTVSDALTCLVRYSFEQLDALNGYAAGMPSPFYYDQVWRAVQPGQKPGPRKPAGRSDVEPVSDEPLGALATKILVQLGQLTRRKKMSTSLSVADEIAALEQARRLAGLRGHPGPTREDLLDGIRSCFVKGSMDAEGAVLLGLAQHTLAGQAIGEVPPEAGLPPLVENFRAVAKELRLNIQDSIRRKVSLDLYRKTGHRKCSRFLHSLCFLDVPFGTVVAGPDFVKGTGLDRLHEHWDYVWTPQAESALVEAGIYGATIDEAAANRLVRAIADLETQGRGRSAGEAVAMLVRACRMGLHRHAGRLLGLIAEQVGEDPDFKSVAQSLNQLVLLWESREPLEAHHLREIPVLVKAAYERACYLLHDLAATPADAAHEMLQALIATRGLLHTHAAREEALDAELFFEPVRALMNHPKAPALLAGGAAGLLHGADRLPDAELLRALSGFLNSASAQPGDQMAFLIGLLRACRELAWRQPALVQAVENLLNAWTEEDFIERLPHLRLAFADLTPRETDQVAELVAGLHGGQKLGRLGSFDITEAEMLAAVRLNAAVRKALEHDGLGGWLAASTETPGQGGAQ